MASEDESESERPAEPADTRGQAILVGMLGAAFLVFAFFVLNGALARDSLTCERDRCVVDRHRFVSAGSSPRYHLAFRPADVTAFESGQGEAKSGDYDTVLTIAEHGDVALRLRGVDKHAAYDARRWLQNPTGRLALEGPRRARDYPFVAILTALGLACFAIVSMHGRRDRKKRAQ